MPSSGPTCPSETEPTCPSETEEGSREAHGEVVKLSPEVMLPYRTSLAEFQYREDGPKRYRSSSDDDHSRTDDVTVPSMKSRVEEGMSRQSDQAVTCPAPNLDDVCER